MSTYTLKISCGNCASERKYEIERGTLHYDADLICPNCGCCPTDIDYKLITEAKPLGRKAVDEE